MEGTRPGPKLRSFGRGQGFRYQSVLADIQLDASRLTLVRCSIRDRGNLGMEKAREYEGWSRHPRRDRTGIKRPLGELEQAVMEIMWALGEAGTTEVHDRLALGRPIAPTTVITTMERLYWKGILLRKHVGKGYLYSPALTRQELEGRIVASVMSDLAREFPAALESYFQDALGEEEASSLDALATMVEQLRRRQGG